MESNNLLMDLETVETPSFIIDIEKLEKNLTILEGIKKRTSCKILFAIKAFAMFKVFPMIRKKLDGICASSQDEARLGREEFNKEVHTHCVAYSQAAMASILQYSDVVVFNSFHQWKRFRPMVHSKPNISCGIRVNPEHSEGPETMFDPCSVSSRLGVRIKNFEKNEMQGISGLHFHTLCAHNSHALRRTLAAFEHSFHRYLYPLSWVNFGGGHQITRDDYDINLLCTLINNFKDQYQVDVYLEPGESVVLNAGYLVASILDIVSCDMPTVILDTSATTHMPDVLEMPYRPHILGGYEKGSTPYSYRIFGVSCLSGDIIGEYSFEKPLHVGDKLIFSDMAHYTIVKNNTFNGIRLPSIFLYHPHKKHLEVVKKFSYDDYKMRLS
jgi:carboxynorspermidine decarboxylase